MTIQCQLIDREALRERGQRPQPGDMWYAPYLLEPENEEYAHEFLTLEYWRDWRDKRPPLYVMLPDGYHFCVDAHASGVAATEPNSGWMVTGEAPNITVHPSIDSGSYHGYLQNGVLTDNMGGIPPLPVRGNR